MQTPSWLDKNAKAYYRSLAGEETSPVHLHLIALAAHNYSVWRNATDQLAKEGEVIVTKTCTKPNPWLQVQKQAFESICRVYKELNLGKPTFPDDAIDEFLTEQSH